MGSFFAAILGKEAFSTLIDALAGPAEQIFRDYIQGKISKEQMLEQLQSAMLDAFKATEVAYLDSITKTYTAFMQTAVQNPVMMKAWSVVLYSQLIVLVWHQVGIPAVDQIFHVRYPSSGATVDWAYALVALCLGAPAIASRVGPAASWAANNIKQLIK